MEKKNATQLGYEIGSKHKNEFFLPEPCPPYSLGTQEANDFLHSYRMARFGYDWQEENQDAINIFKEALEDGSNTNSS